MREWQTGCALELHYQVKAPKQAGSQVSFSLNILFPQYTNQIIIPIFVDLGEPKISHFEIYSKGSRRELLHIGR